MPEETAENPPPPPVDISFPHQKVDVRNIRSNQLEEYGRYRGILRELAFITEDQITGDPATPGTGIDEIEDFHRDPLYSSLPMALFEIAHASLRFGLAKNIIHSGILADYKETSKLGIEREVELLDTQDGHRKIIIETDGEHRKVRIVDPNRKVEFDGEKYDLALLTLQIPAHMDHNIEESSIQLPDQMEDEVKNLKIAGYSNFRATRYDETNKKTIIIDPGATPDKATAQAFALVIRDVASDLVRALPEKERVKAVLEDQGWGEGDTPSAGSGGGGGDEPNKGGPSGGSDPVEDELQRILANESALAMAEVPRTQRRMQAPIPQEDKSTER